MAYSLFVVGGLLILIGVFILNKKFITDDSILSVIMFVSELIISLSLVIAFFLAERNYQLLTANCLAGGSKRWFAIMIFVFGLFLKLDLDTGVYLFLSKRTPRLLSLITVVIGITPMVCILAAICLMSGFLQTNSLVFEVLNSVASLCFSNNNVLLEIFCILLFIVPIVRLLLIRFGIDEFDAGNAVCIADSFLKIGYKTSVGLVVFWVKILVSIALFAIAVVAKATSTR